ncbi:hypothetical protein L484_000796 [Morus notabilis]|uniref:Uncharacterized protein n=1 Tax=Morus notabilis TaxID=981085 RepID=W9RER6_9ROSA|nr:hypothetical protein L484_000796 [Morus notabilis]
MGKILFINWVYSTNKLKTHVHHVQITVVLLLRSGTRRPQEGPFSVVINRPPYKKIKHMKPTNIDLATTFSDCFLHFGGPLEASMFLLKTGLGRSKLPGFEEVIPGLCFGARNSLDEAAELVKKGVLKPQDFRFFVGYAKNPITGMWLLAAQI